MSFIVRNINNYDQAAKKFGEGLGEGYMQGSDDRAIRKAVETLPPNASYREILNAVSGVTTYNPKSKQQAVENLIKSHRLELDERKASIAEKINQAKGKAQAERDERAVAQLEETKRHNQVVEANAAAKIAGTATKEDKKKENAEQRVRTTLKAKGYPQKLIDEYAPTMDPADARTLEPYNKEEYNRNYKKAENQAKPYEKQISNIYAKGSEAPAIINRQKIAIQNNEQYGPVSKVWDSLLESVNSPLANMLKTKKGQELDAISPIAIASIADKMGGVLSVKKIQVIEKKVAGIGKDKNANRLFLHLDYYDQLLNQAEANATQEIISENEFGLPPVDFQKQLNEKMKPLRDQIDRDIDVLLKDKIPHSAISPSADKSRLPPLQNPKNIYVRNKTTGETGELSPEELADYPTWERIDATNNP